VADRAHVLGLLQRELAAARDVREDAYAAQLERRIAAYSRGSAADPATESTAAASPAAETTTAATRPARRKT
jgi:hypothetical protein